jgi:hypothetical protein
MKPSFLVNKTKIGTYMDIAGAHFYGDFLYFLKPSVWLILTVIYQQIMA